MPPMKRLGTECSQPQLTPRKQRVQSSKLNKPIVHSTIPESIKISGNSSLDSDSMTSTTDAFTVNTGDRQYIQLSKRILQYEMKRKRLNIRTMSEQPHLEDAEISLSTSVPSDWRLILQDSITTEDLRQGCLSLFDQIDSALILSQTEINHAVRFLKYACMHIERRESPHNKLLETIFPEEEHRTTRLIWSLINLLSLPSDTLRTAAIFFVDVGLRNSSKVFTIEIALTGLLPKLFSVLKPHEIPLNDTTIEFHRHLTSIVDTFFYFVSPEDIKYRLGETSRTSDAIESFYQSLCSYLQYLVDSPVSLPDHRSGSTFLLNTRLFSPSNIKNHCESSSPTVERFFGEIRKKMMDELDSLFGSASARNVEHFIRSGRLEESDIPSWVTAFESLLGRVSEGNKISDFAVDEVTDFISRFPSLLKIFFSSDDSFCLTKHNTIVSSSKLDSQALWTLFIPSQPHHAAAYLTAFSKFVTTLDSVTDRIHVWNEWFPRFIHTVDPSKQPFTFEFTKLHTTLIKLLDDRFKRIRYLRWARRWPLMEKLHSELDELHLAFSKQTKDYIVHLSLHPFALDSQGQDVILDFLREEYFLPSTNRQTRHFHEEVRREMDESELSSSSPPFILTSELVLCHTSDEIISIVDRIVALLASDSPLDDDTILRIFAFHRKALSQVYLPELFRAAGRSTEQYFHALESLLTFHVNCSPQTPIDNLLSTRPDKHEPTLDEWDDVDLETGLILMRVLNQNTLSLTSDSPQPNELLLDYLVRCLPQARICAARHPQPQLERLISPSFTIFGTHFIQPRLSEMREAQRRERAFVDILKLCDERVIARCVSRTGFFSRLVNDLLNPDFVASDSLFHLIVSGGRFASIGQDDQKAIRKTVHRFLEEGWQDALETIFVEMDFNSRHSKDSTRRLMQFFGTNLVEVRWY